MKKNKFLRLASFMLIACLATCCAVGGTFAKYTTSANAGDSARVAKWGVTIEVEAGVDNDAQDAFFTTYAKDSTSSITNAVNATVKVVAPGTEGTLATFSIAGTPEVGVKLTFDVTDSAGTGEAKDIFVDTYNPIRFAIYKNGSVVSGSESLTLAELITNVEALTGEYEPLTNLGATYRIDWVWAFEQLHDAEDTLLGDIAADAANAGTRVEGTDYSLTIDFGLKITAEQID